jgi:hypothetical protein
VLIINVSSNSTGQDNFPKWTYSSELDIGDKFTWHVKEMNRFGVVIDEYTAYYGFMIKEGSKIVVTVKQDPRKINVLQDFEVPYYELDYDIFAIFEVSIDEEIQTDNFPHMNFIMPTDFQNQNRSDNNIFELGYYNSFLQEDFEVSQTSEEISLKGYTDEQLHLEIKWDYSSGVLNYWNTINWFQSDVIFEREIPPSTNLIFRIGYASPYTYLVLIVIIGVVRIRYNYRLFY